MLYFSQEYMERYQNFQDMLKRISQEVPEKPVFFYEEDGKKTICWADFYTMVQERSSLLAKDPFTCLGIFTENTLACMVEVFAANLAGKQIVLLDPIAPAALLAKQITATDVDCLWGNPLRAAEVSHAVTKGCTNGRGKILFFTSGTTSAAKAVVLSDASLMQSAWNGGSLLPLGKEDILLDMLPLHHVFGFVCGLLWGMTSQAAVALGRGPRHYLDDCTFYQPTAISLVPMLFGFLVQHNLFNPQLQLVLVGAGDCSHHLLQAVKDKGIRVSFGYGLTETSSGVALSIGEDPTAMTICPDDTITLAQDGEILIQAPTCMMQGYYKRKEATDAVLVDGVLHTGDLGHFDADGLLHIIGRKKEMLVLPDGTKIFLPEYEKAIKELLSTEELAVVLHRHMPVLVMNELQEEEEKIKQKLEPLMKSQTRSHQLSSIISLHHSLPRTAAGKIKHWEIQKEIEELWSKEKKF